MARRLTCFALLLLLMAGMIFPVAQGEVSEFRVRRGNPDSPKIAITVDDCSNEELVESIADLAKEYDICLTFFPIGYKMERQDPGLWQRIAAWPKFEIGCHTQNHRNWDYCRPYQIRDEITEFCDTLDRVLGYHYPIKQVRPPYGHCSTTASGGHTRRVAQILEPLGFDHVVLWTVSNTDAKKACYSAKNGAIFLYHANQKDYLCLKTLIPQLLEKGYQPVTVSELLKEEN